MMACFMALSGPGYLRHYAPGDKGCDDDCGSADDWPIRRQYLAALYWAMSTMTTVGYGDITPQSDAERAYCMVGMAVGGGFYGYVIGIIATLVAVSDANARAYNEKMGVVNAWLDFNDLPRELRRKVRAYFKQFLAERSALDEQAILNDLDPSLRAEIGRHLIPDAVRACELFSGLAPTVLAKLSTLLRPVPAATGDVLQVRGTHGVVLHVVVAGAVELHYGDHTVDPALLSPETNAEPSRGAYWGKEQDRPTASAPAKPPIVIGRGETFGELVVLSVEKYYDATGVAIEPTALYMIEQDNLYERFAGMPEAVNAMRQHAIEARENRESRAHKDEGAQKRYKHMRSSLVGGGGATLPTGFADTMLEALGDIQQRLEEIYERLDGIEGRAPPPGRSSPDCFNSAPAEYAKRAVSAEDDCVRRSPAVTKRGLSGVDAEHWLAARAEADAARRLRRPSLTRSRSTGVLRDPPRLPGRSAEETRPDARPSMKRMQSYPAEKNDEPPSPTKGGRTRQAFAAVSRLLSRKADDDADAGRSGSAHH
jgi:CRP-like cAMP-binding protein